MYYVCLAFLCVSECINMYQSNNDNCSHLLLQDLLASPFMMMDAHICLGIFTIWDEYFKKVNGLYRE